MGMEQLGVESGGWTDVFRILRRRRYHMYPIQLVGFIVRGHTDCSCRPPIHMMAGSASCSQYTSCSHHLAYVRARLGLCEERFRPVHVKRKVVFIKGGKGRLEQQTGAPNCKPATGEGATFFVALHAIHSNSLGTNRVLLAVPVNYRGGSDDPHERRSSTSGEYLAENVYSPKYSNRDIFILY